MLLPVSSRVCLAGALAGLNRGHIYEHTHTLTPLAGHLQSWHELLCCQVALILSLEFSSKLKLCPHAIMQTRLNMAEKIYLDLKMARSCTQWTDHMLHVTCIRRAFCGFCFTVRSYTQQTSHTSHDAHALLRFVRADKPVSPIHIHGRHSKQ